MGAGSQRRARMGIVCRARLQQPLQAAPDQAQPADRQDQPGIPGRARPPPTAATPAAAPARWASIRREPPRSSSITGVVTKTGADCRRRRRRPKVHPGGDTPIEHRAKRTVGDRSIPPRPRQRRCDTRPASEAGGRAGVSLGLLRQPPSSESHRRRPLLIPPRSHDPYPVVPVPNLTAGIRVHPSPGRTATATAPPMASTSQVLVHARSHPVEG
jgi:hypothetical protein